jgi:hypothetical protein
MLAALSAAGAEYLVVGAHPLAAGPPWRGAGQNARGVWRALEAFGAPLHDLTLEDLSRPDIVFQIGLAPKRIDLLTSITGVGFEEASKNRVVVEIEGLEIPVLGRAELIRNKRVVGRPRDLADIEELGETN